MNKKPYEDPEVKRKLENKKKKKSDVEGGILSYRSFFSRRRKLVKIFTKAYIHLYLFH